MHAEMVEQLISQHIPGCDVTAEGEGCSFTVRVVSDQFIDMPKVKRQQMVYAIIQDKITSGEIHALSLKTLSKAEYLAKN